MAFSLWDVRGPQTHFPHTLASHELPKRLNYARFSGTYWKTINCLWQICRFFIDCSYQSHRLSLTLNSHSLQSQYVTLPLIYRIFTGVISISLHKCASQESRTYKMQVIAKPMKDTFMEFIIAGTISIGLLIYLVYAIFNPDKLN